jgi:hypothetical protein
MTFVFRAGVGTMVPLGGGAPIPLSSIRTTVELYRLAHGALFSVSLSRRVRGGKERSSLLGLRSNTKRLVSIDLHACRTIFSDWLCYEQQIHALASANKCNAHDIKAAIDLINPQTSMLVVPDQVRFATQQNATRYACLATTLDMLLNTDLIRICAAYSDIEAPRYRL